MGQTLQMELQSEVSVYKTTDYKVFKRLKGNREINQLNLINLKESIKKNYYPTPIYVNEKFEVVDGQHRLSVLEELSLPVYYIILEGATIETVHTFNTQGLKWTLKDFAKSYAEAGREPYIKFLELHKRDEKIPLNVIFKLITGKHKDTKALDKFKKGELEIDDVVEIESTYKKLFDFKICKNFYYQNFLFSVMKIFQNPAYDHERMIKKLPQGLEFLDAYENPTIHYNLYLLSEVYNLHMNSANRVYFADTYKIPYTRM